MDHDADVIWIVERHGTPLECCIVEIPPRRSSLPDELREIASIFVVAGPAAVRGEIELVPPLEFGLWRQRHLTGCLTADQIAADRDEPLAPLRPKRRDDVSRPCSPIVTGKDGLLDLERVH